MPYFQTLGDNADITITPTVWGNWGVGGEIEFRKSFKIEMAFILKVSWSMIIEMTMVSLHILARGDFLFGVMTKND